MYPVLYRLGSIEIYSYGVMLMLGFLAAVFWARREARKRGVSPDRIIDLALWVLVLGVAFARLVFIALEWDYYRHQSFIGIFYSGGRFAIQGLSFHGGLLGALIGGLIYARLAKISWLTLADICAPAVALGYGFGRIGCFLNGCCYGAPADLPWAVAFPLHYGFDESTGPSHPTQLYAALGSWLIFGLLLLLRRPLRAGGQLFFGYLALYSVLRFFIEILRRGYSAQIAFDALTQAQIASAAIFVLSLLALLVLRGRPTTLLEDPDDLDDD